MNEMMSRCNLNAVSLGCLAKTAYRKNSCCADAILATHKAIIEIPEEWKSVLLVPK